MSRPNTFWRFSVIWKVFASCSIATFTLAFLSNVKQGNLSGDWSGSSLKFGKISDTVNINALYLLPAAFVLGVIGGLLGALFINVNTRMNNYRKVLLKTKGIKVFETFLWSFTTASVFYWAPKWYNKCRPVSPNESIDAPNIWEGWCHDYSSTGQPD